MEVKKYPICMCFVLSVCLVLISCGQKPEQTKQQPKVKAQLEQQKPKQEAKVEKSKPEDEARAELLVVKETAVKEKEMIEAINDELEMLGDAATDDPELADKIAVLRDVLSGHQDELNAHMKQLKSANADTYELE